mmetsp:Transcript_1519/g.5375  ORF Transcript_1519/g.5375 Transcript_1519/m.5375 type:complete len:520 (-) Transcript_1519:775-2334(-)
MPQLEGGGVPDSKDACRVSGPEELLVLRKLHGDHGLLVAEHLAVEDGSGLLLLEVVHVEEAGDGFLEDVLVVLGDALQHVVHVGDLAYVGKGVLLDLLGVQQIRAYHLRDVSGVHAVDRAVVRHQEHQAEGLANEVVVLLGQGSQDLLALAEAFLQWEVGQLQDTLEVLELEGRLGQEAQPLLEDVGDVVAVLRRGKLHSAEVVDLLAHLVHFLVLPRQPENALLANSIGEDVSERTANDAGDGVVGQQLVLVGHEVGQRDAEDLEWGDIARQLRLDSALVLQQCLLQLLYLREDVAGPVDLLRQLRERVALDLQLFEHVHLLELCQGHGLNLVEVHVEALEALHLADGSRYLLDLVVGETELHEMREFEELLGEVLQVVVVQAKLLQEGLGGEDRVWQQRKLALAKAELRLLLLLCAHDLRDHVNKARCQVNAVVAHNCASALHEDLVCVCLGGDLNVAEGLHLLADLHGSEARHLPGSCIGDGLEQAYQDDRNVHSSRLVRLHPLVGHLGEATQAVR